MAIAIGHRTTTVPTTATINVDVQTTADDKVKTTLVGTSIAITTTTREDRRTKHGTEYTTATPATIDITTDDHVTPSNNNADNNNDGKTALLRGTTSTTPGAAIRRQLLHETAPRELHSTNRLRRQRLMTSLPDQLPVPTPPSRHSGPVWPEAYNVDIINRSGRKYLPSSNETSTTYYATSTRQAPTTSTEEKWR